MTQPALFHDAPPGPRPFAIFSDCLSEELCPDPACDGRLYRYLLSWPTGNESSTRAVFVLANPSTASAEKTDPTVERCIQFARIWGHAWCDVLNVRAWRATDPRKVPADPLAIGRDNDRHIERNVRRAAIVVVGWGHLAGARGPVVIDIIRRAGKVPHALQLNLDGTPSHPLSRGKRRIPADAVPFPMEVA